MLLVLLACIATARAQQPAAPVAQLVEQPVPRDEATSGAPKRATHRLSLAKRLGECWRWRTIEGPDGVSLFTEVRPWKDGLIALDHRGLVAYDGYEWRREPGWDKFSYQRLREVIPQEDGLLVLTSNAVVSIDSAGMLTTLRQVQSPYRITKPCRLPDGALLIGAENSILRADHSGLREAFPTPEGAVMLSALLLDGDGQLLIATDLGIHRRAGDAWERVAPAAMHRSPQQPAPHWIAYALPADNRVNYMPSVIDPHAMRIIWDDREKTSYYDRDSISPVMTAVGTPEGELVLALRLPELRVLSNGDSVSVPLPGGRQDTVKSMCFTEDGRLAIVFSSGELAVCDLRSTCWEQYDPTEVGAGTFVSSLASASAGGVWVGTTAGVARWDRERFTDVHVEPEELAFPLHLVTALLEDARGRLWVGSGAGFQGAACLDNGRWSLRDDPVTGIGPHFVHAIRRDGDDLWFLLLGDPLGNWLEGGLVRLRGDTFTHFRTDLDGAPMPRCYDLLRRSDGTLLVGAQGALLEQHGDGWRRVEDGPPLGEHRSAFALAETADGDLLVGLGIESEGIFRLSRGRWTEMVSDSGRPAPAASFSTTTDGRQWFASGQGLFLANASGFHDVSSLLPSRTMWPLLSDGDDALWIGLLGGGLARFCPADREPPRTLPPELEFAEDGTVVARWRSADAWNSTPPDQLRYLVHLDGERLPTSSPELFSSMHTRRLSLGKLSPGPHRLTIAAVDRLGNTELQPALRDFMGHAAPAPAPVLFSPPVVAGIALALLLAIIWSVMTWMHRLREREQARVKQEALTERLTALTRRLLSTQEDERRSLSRELHDNLGQICTALCIDIQRAARQPDPVRRAETLDHALGISRDMLDRVRRMSFELRPLLLDDHGLKHAVSVALADFTAVTGVDVQSELQFAGPEPPPELSGHIYRILQEAITNVARHARAQSVDVGLHTSDQRIDLTVKDDGEGFEPETLSLQQRFGLLGMRERAELMGGSFRLQSSPRSGTSIHVSIPFKRPGVEGSPAVT